MGFFDNLLKAAEKGIKEAVGSSALEEIKNAVSKNLSMEPLRPETKEREHYETPVRSYNDGGGHTKDYFKSILGNEFNGCAVKDSVWPSEIGGEGREYDFGLYRDGQLAAVVVLVEHNRDNNAAYHNAKKTAAGKGIPFINFYLHMPNKRDFVIARINRLMA